VPYLQERKTVIMPKMLVKEGSFSRVKSVACQVWWPTEFIACRERFQTISHDITRIIFTHKRRCGPSIAAFIDTFENKLEFNKKSIFGPTQREDVTWLVASRWWVSHNIRRSLFTALLREGQNYNIKKDNFKKVLFSDYYGRRNYYTRQTRKAVERFLEGYTVLQSGVYFPLGWWDFFYGHEYRSNLLLRP